MRCAQRMTCLVLGLGDGAQLGQVPALAGAFPTVLLQKTAQFPLMLLPLTAQLRRALLLPDPTQLRLRKNTVSGSQQEKRINFAVGMTYVGRVLRLAVE